MLLFSSPLSIAALSTFFLEHLTNHPALVVKPSPLGGLGLFTTSPIPAETTLLTIPQSYKLTSQSALADPSLKSLLDQPNLPDTLTLAAYIAKLSLSSDSKFSPYIEFVFESVSIDKNGFKRDTDAEAASLLFDAKKSFSYDDATKAKDVKQKKGKGKRQ